MDIELGQEVGEVGEELLIDEEGNLLLSLVAKIPSFEEIHVGPSKEALIRILVLYNTVT